MISNFSLMVFVLSGVCQRCRDMCFGNTAEVEGLLLPQWQ